MDDHTSVFINFDPFDLKKVACTVRPYRDDLRWVSCHVSRGDNERLVDGVADCGLVIAVLEGCGKADVPIFNWT